MPTFEPQDLDASVAIDAAVTGQATDFAVDATLTARAQSPDLSAPAIAGTARYSRDLIDVRLRAPEGLSVGTAVLDSATVHYRTEAHGGALPAEVALTVTGPDYGWRQHARIDSDTGVTLQTDPSPYEPAS